jgi:hypothetical protein
MKFLACWLIGLTAGLSCAMAGELAGTWEGKFIVGTKARYAGFDLNVAGDRVTGAAFIQPWGYSVVSDGRVEGDQFRFTVDKYSQNRTVEKIEFSGAVTDKSMTLAMIDGRRHEMTLHRVESQVTGPVSVEAAPKELEGEWRARFVGRIGDRPKMIGSIDFDFHVEGNTLTGVARTGSWPGDCRITQGKVESGRFSFTATGSRPSSTGIPVMRFEGEIHGKQLKLIMRHQIFGGDNGVWLPMDGMRMRTGQERNPNDPS